MTPEQLAARVLADCPRYELEQAESYMGSAFMALEPGYGDWVKHDDALAAVSRLFAPGDDLVKRLETKAAMIALGEKIAWGSDSAIMQEAAARLSALTAERDDFRSCLATTSGKLLVAEAEVSRLRDRLARMKGAIRALGALPEGYCFCSKNRVGDASKEHEPECADLRAIVSGGQDD